MELKITGFEYGDTRPCNGYAADDYYEYPDYIYNRR